MTSGQYSDRKAATAHGGAWREVAVAAGQRRVGSTSQVEKRARPRASSVVRRRSRPRQGGQYPAARRLPTPFPNGLGVVTDPEGTSRLARRDLSRTRELLRVIMEEVYRLFD